MRSLGNSLAGMLFAVCLASNLLHAQPSIPKDKIPTSLPRDVKTQVQRLYSKDPIERGYAAVALGNMGSKAAPAIPFLAAMGWDDVALRWTTDPSGSVGLPTSPAAEAMDALVAIGPKAVGPLIAMLKDPNSDVKKTFVVETLGKTKDARAVEPLIAIVNDPELDDSTSNLRVQAIEALGEIRDTRAIQPLIAMLGSSGVPRNRAVEALAKYDNKAVEPLIAAMRHPNATVKFHAVQTLREIKDPRVIGPFIAGLEDRDVRPLVIQGLGEMKDPRAVEPLVAFLRNRDEAGPKTNSLKAADEPGAVASSLPPLPYRDIRRLAILALGEIGDSRAIQPLIAILGETDSDLRSTAASALRRITGEDLGSDHAKWSKWLESKPSLLSTP